MNTPNVGVALPQGGLMCAKLSPGAKWPFSLGAFGLIDFSAASLCPPSKLMLVMHKHNRLSLDDQTHSRKHILLRVT
jgi:hypothetical protein